ncbi:hypothetical protein [Sphaerisporangium krabiense]|uniref:Beta-phosphoglucomutase-like phosphatase (HAD superfamily) n=1 Tax=Sphaerisporangium krabiense TaxID=763782 RepID=A0A7W8ZA00_9ACTN|nr:hypothetical protein [Sphaerisporangium krabiense]MBB5630181.1 beta-phosphoglucomutase-like phosphatase (HAD superfamily) [Sphaerisporangium krabiense]
MPIPHDAVVFDCDGALADTGTAWNDACRDLFARYGMPLDPAARTRLAGPRPAEPGEEPARLLGRPAPDPVV